jgi:Holliday junction resolvase
MKPRTEQQIQTAIMEKLRAAGWYVNKLIVTSLVGVPDLIAHKEGRTMYIEVKRPGKMPTELQEHRMQELGKYGVNVMVCSDEKELIL